MDATARERFTFQFNNTRRVDSTLIYLDTADAQLSIEWVMSGLNGNGYTKQKPEGTKLFQWDSIRGILPLQNELGIPNGLQRLTNPQEMISAVPDNLPKNSVLFVHNAQMCFAMPPFIQGVWNCRDLFRNTDRTLVLMGPGINLPPALVNDVVVIDQPLPSAADLVALTQNILSGIEPEKRPTVDEKLIVDATIGLASYAAEQVIAGSLVPNQERTAFVLDSKGLWVRKAKMISQTPGLSIKTDPRTYLQVGGCANAKDFYSRIFTGKNPPRCVVFWDECEKSLAGASAGGDNTGVKQGQMQTILTELNDRDYRCVLQLGPPGSGKTLIGVTTGSEFERPVVIFDLGAMLNSLVGASEQNIRAAFKTIYAISEGRALWIATCNSTYSLPTELMRRFKTRFFFDFPDAAEREVIWNIMLTKYGLPIDSPRPEDNMWTGAEIAVCCDNANVMGITPQEAASYVVPVALTRKIEMDSLRGEAENKYISASKPGLYQKTNMEASLPPANAPKRRLSMDVN